MSVSFEDGEILRSELTPSSLHRNRENFSKPNPLFYKKKKAILEDCIVALLALFHDNHWARTSPSTSEQRVEPGFFFVSKYTGWSIVRYHLYTSLKRELHDLSYQNSFSKSRPRINF